MQVMSFIMQEGFHLRKFKIHLHLSLEEVRQCRDLLKAESPKFGRFDRRTGLLGLCQESLRVNVAVFTLILSLG
jgi:hypothetical protein